MTSGVSSGDGDCSDSSGDGGGLVAAMVQAAAGEQHLEEGGSRLPPHGGQLQYLVG